MCCDMTDAALNQTFVYRLVKWNKVLVVAVVCCGSEYYSGGDVLQFKWIFVVFWF